MQTKECTHWCVSFYLRIEHQQKNPLYCMNISIQKYQELYEISMMNSTESEKASLLIQSLMDMNEDEVKELPELKYKKICKDINSIFDKFTEDMKVNNPKQYVRIGKNIYRFNYNLAKLPMNTGRYIETATFVSNLNENIHKILATMAIPMKITICGLRPKDERYWNHEDIANDMLKLNFQDGYQSCVFFCKIFKESMINSNTYFKTISENPEMHRQFLNNLQEISDGYTMQSWFRSLKI